MVPNESSDQQEELFKHVLAGSSISFNRIFENRYK